MATKKVSTLPTCNFCSSPAYYDAPMLGHSTWAYFCRDCWSERGSHTIYTQFELMTDSEVSYASSGVASYDADLEDKYMATLDLEEIMEESLFGDSCGIEVADGCVVEPDGKCSHGYTSPLRLAGLI